MGREIRRVPKGWEHPVDERGHFRALYDEPFEEAAKKWLDEANLWAQGKHPDQADGDVKYPFYWQWSGNPPDANSYRPAFTAPADAYQIYETVSEGSPVSPVFETIEAMIEWMIKPIDRSSPYNKGEDWQCMQGMTQAQAERFCKNGSAPSLISSPGTGVVGGHRA